MNTTVYILQCANGQYYVGSTNNLANRLQEHQLSDGALFKGARFTKAHLPVKLVYTEEYEDEPKMITNHVKIEGDGNEVLRPLSEEQIAQAEAAYNSIPPEKRM